VQDGLITAGLRAVGCGVGGAVGVGAVIFDVIVPVGAVGGIERGNIACRVLSTPVAIRGKKGGYRNNKLTNYKDSR